MDKEKKEKKSKTAAAKPAAAKHAAAKPAAPKAAAKPAAAKPAAAKTAAKPVKAVKAAVKRPAKTAAAKPEKPVKAVKPKVQEIKAAAAVSTAAPVAAAPAPAAPAPVVPAPVVSAPVVSAPAAPAPAVSSPAAAASAAPALKELEIEIPIMVKDLAVRLQLKPSVLIKDMMMMRIMAGINQNLDHDTAAKVALKYGYTIKAALEKEEELIGEHAEEDRSEDLKHRAPIVTIMGHVDHGKTSILDSIRKSKVAESEHGGITQHVGAYRVKLPQGEITFLDTPGHEAFTAMRSRGAQVTDIVVLVVAADDGVMPQTKEALDHARAAGVCIMVALNKMDKPGADVNRVKKQLAELNLQAEDWGGKTIMVPVSAKTGQGIDDLLEMILLEAQMLELKANPSRHGRGIVLEAKMVKNRGPVATLLVQNGTLRLNDTIIAGNAYGKVRAMADDRRQPVTSAGPSYPVEVLGLSDVPAAGEQFFVVPDEKTAREIWLQRQEKERLHQMQPVKRMSLEDLYGQIKEGKLKELKLIIKADAQGSVEAIKESLKKIPQDEVQINVIHDGVGNINSSDIILAVASQALVLGFNVTPDEPARELIAKEDQDVKVYNVIYELVNDIRAAMEGMLSPKLKRVFLGRADVRKIFRLSSGTFGGCMVTKGTINRKASVSVMRNGKSVFEGELASLKRFKDDVREVEEGFECGMSVKGFNELMEGDTIEAFEVQKIARTL